ncbi:hypothetical protein B0T24DRAFT_625958, partial [Lasiosphaeria ovina]
MDKHKSCCPFSPTVNCGFRNVDKCSTFVVKLAWSGHMPLTMGRDGYFEAQHLENGLRKLYQEQGHFVCPQIRPGPVAGATLCDPTRCDCVNYAGRTETGWPRPPAEWKERATCRVNREHGLGRGSVVKHLRKKGLGCQRINGQCYHEFSQGRPFQGCYDLQSADIIGCEKDNDCIVVSYHSCVAVALDESNQHLRDMNANWYHALDPDSYSLTKDIEGFGVYWCKGQGCRNYYRFTRSRLRGVLKPSEYVRT